MRVNVMFARKQVRRHFSEIICYRYRHIAWSFLSISMQTFGFSA